MSNESFAVSGIVNLEVTNHAGEIVIDPTAGDEVIVTVTAIDTNAQTLVDDAIIESHATAVGTTVRVKVPKGRGAFDDIKEMARDGRDEASFFRLAKRLLSGHANDVRVHIGVPDGANLLLKTTSAHCTLLAPLTNVSAKSVSGDIELIDCDGEVSLTSVSGELTIEQCGGETELQSTSGDIKVTNAFGPLAIRTVSGEVAVADAHEALNVTTTSGDLVAGAHLGGAMRTVSGDVRVGPVESGEIVVGTVSGDVIVDVAKGALVSVDAESLSGELTSTIALDASEPDSESGSLIDLKVRTLSGDVLITSSSTGNTRRSQKADQVVNVFEVGR